MYCRQHLTQNKNIDKKHALKRAGSLGGESLNSFSILERGIRIGSKIFSNKITESCMSMCFAWRNSFFFFFSGQHSVIAGFDIFVLLVDIDSLDFFDCIRQTQVQNV
ncbi:hypothetical protein WA026_002333 [Henosepilachna vigintioctopunctata]|uniref:Uncharacterized protein n=1 Tax=Henosepilachna vigintioctopunctata TaxID=420089 RepID=A0AAW1TUH9_9CUCU